MILYLRCRGKVQGVGQIDLLLETTPLLVGSNSKLDPSALPMSSIESGWTTGRADSQNSTFSEEQRRSIPVTKRSPLDHLWDHFVALEATRGTTSRNLT